jgi:hypothetical protein
MADLYRSFDAWHESFMNLDAFEIGKTYRDAIASKADCLGDINFHSAAVDRLLEHAWLSPELSDGQRKACTGFATRGIELVEAMWTANNEVVERFHKAIENATASYIPFSSPMVREFMREFSPPHRMSH